MNPITTYRENTAAGSNPVHLVVMLYEQIIKDLREAVAAMRANNIEVRAQAIDHALLVTAHLQGTLNFEQGGEVARNLDRFYTVLQSTMLEAQFQNTPELLEAQIQHLLGLREAWTQVERTVSGVPAESVIAAPSADSGPEEHRSMSFTG